MPYIYQSCYFLIKFQINCVLTVVEVVVVLHRGEVVEDLRPEVVVTRYFLKLVRFNFCFLVFKNVGSSYDCFSKLISSAKTFHISAKMSKRKCDEAEEMGKRLRWQNEDEIVDAEPRKEPLLDRLLLLDKHQLIGILGSLAAENRHIGLQIDALLPRPSIANVLFVFAGLQKQLLEALPYNKSGHDGSDYAYNRVHLHLKNIEKCVMHHIDQFSFVNSGHKQLEYAHETFQYLHLATNVAHSLPVWDTPAHNKCKHSLYNVLARQWLIVIPAVARTCLEQGRVPVAIVAEWAQHLNEHCAKVSGQFAFNDALHLFKIGRAHV